MTKLGSIGALYKNLTRGRIWGSQAPPLGPEAPKCGDLLSYYAKSQQTDVGVAVGHSTTSVGK